MRDKLINQVKADFEAKTGAKVEVKVYTDYNTQIQADFIAGTAPDAFYIDAIMFPFYSGLGVLEPLDRSISLSFSLNPSGSMR